MDKRTITRRILSIESRAQTERINIQRENAGDLKEDPLTKNKTENKHTLFKEYDREIDRLTEDSEKLYPEAVTDRSQSSIEDRTQEDLLRTKAWKDLRERSQICEDKKYGIPFGKNIKSPKVK